MHPADQFKAFFKLHREDGMSAEDIAARFGVTAAVVRQRLKLAAVSPVLMEAYRDGKLNLDQLTGFAITDDHAEQVRVWDQLGYNDSREAILDALTEEHIDADDRRAVFVGIEAYRAAGGAILRDLFDDEGGGFLTDPDLLNRLADEKLQSEAETVRAEGWKWVDVRQQYDHVITADMRRIYPEIAPRSEADQAKLDALEAEYEAITEGDGTTATQAEIDDMEHSIAVLGGEDVFDAAQIAMAGAIVTIGYDGEPRIERGFVRGEDDNRPASRKASAPKDGPAPLSAALVAELTAYRTLALRDALGQQPDIALVAVTHALAASTFFPYARRGSCLEMRGHGSSLAVHASGIDETPTGQRITARHEGWAKRMPDAPDALWAFVAGLSEGERRDLLAHCAALTLDAVQTPHASETGALAHADQVAEARASRYAGALDTDRQGVFQPGQQGTHP